MIRSLPIPPPGFDELPTDEKVRYVETLWDRIAATPDGVPVPDWHRQLVSNRLAEHRRERGAGRRWQAVRDDLLRELAENEPTPR
jgi:putative addiction module component (TIGR02574 family)